MATAQDIVFLIQHCATLLDKQSDQVLQEQLGIGLAQFKILQVLQAKPRITQRDIAVTLGQTEASISRQVKLMQADGLLQSIRNPQDQREHVMSVTLKGERLAGAALQALERYHQPTLAALSDRQQEQFVGVLAKLHEQLCRSDHLD